MKFKKKLRKHATENDRVLLHIELEATGPESAQGLGQLGAIAATRSISPDQASMIIGMLWPDDRFGELVPVQEPGESLAPEEILFIPEMVQAIRNGDKTETRRVIKTAGVEMSNPYHHAMVLEGSKYQIGRRLIVREVPSDGGVPTLTGIVLRIVDVGVEQIQECTDDDALCEGIRVHTRMLGKAPHLNIFRKTFDSIYKERGFPWASNPWVFVVRFEVSE